MPADAIAFDAFGTLFDLEALRGPLGDDVFERFAARLVPWTWHVTAAGGVRPPHQDGGGGAGGGGPPGGGGLPAPARSRGGRPPRPRARTTPPRWRTS